MTTRNKILLFAPHFSEYSTRLAQALGDHADVLLILNSRDRRRQCDPAWFAAATAKLRVIEFTVHNRIWRTIVPPLLIMAARLFRPNIVLVQEQPDIPTSWFSAAVRKWAPVVLTVHDPKPHTGGDTEFLKRGALRYRDRIRASASLFHVHGEYCRQEMLAIDASRPVVQTYHGVIHVPRADQLAQSEPDRVLFFGRMEAYKGLEVLLDAMDLLNARGRLYTLVFAGRGDELDRLADRAKATRGVVVMGHFLTLDEVIGEFQKAAVVVLPYLDATQSGVAAAAIGNGRPMVASAIGGLKDIIIQEENGLLVPPGDAPALAEALDRVLQDTALRQKMTAGSLADQSRLDWAHAARSLVDAYSALPQARWSNG